MREPHFGSVRSDIERDLEPPDFAAIAQRGRRIRRRRHAAVAGAAVVTLAVVGAGAFAGTTSPRTERTPVDVPTADVPTPDTAADALQVLADPRASMDLDSYAVNREGDILTVVHAPGAPSRPQCPPRGDTVFVWLGGDGARRAWTDYGTARGPAAVDGGFVVPGVDAGCLDPEHPDDAVPYVVDGEGERHEIAWEPGADGDTLAQRCRFAVSFDDRCRVDLAGRRGWVAYAEDVDLPPRSIAVDVTPGAVQTADFVHADRVWARTVDSRRLYWSDDHGRTWDQRDTTLSPDGNVAIVAAGRWIGFAGSTEVEISSDGGDTWAVHDLSAALAPIPVTEVGWTVMESGRLLGVTGGVGQGDRLFRSTDASWRSFEPVPDLRTRTGFIQPEVAGRHVFVPDEQRWLHSSDEGATWRVVDPFG